MRPTEPSYFGSGCLDVMNRELNELGAVKRAMADMGFELVDQTYGTMDSGNATFKKGKRVIRIWKDRSIWEMQGEREDLESIGAWKGYPDTDEFITNLRRIVTQTNHNNASKRTASTRSA